MGDDALIQKLKWKDRNALDSFRRRPTAHFTDQQRSELVEELYNRPRPGEEHWRGLIKRLLKANGS